MALHDAARRHDQLVRLGAKTAQRLGGLAHEEAVIDARRPSHVPQPFDRVHVADATRTSPLLDERCDARSGPPRG
jgi:hypothetical protein